MRTFIVLAALAASATAFVAPSSGRVLSSRAKARKSNARMGCVVDESEALKRVLMTHPSGATATVYTLGGCVTSYVKDGDEVLAVRPDAKLDGSKPISGGVPHCFPQFGPGAIQQHGFARNLEWDVADMSDETLVLSLKPSDYTKEMWDHEFELLYTISLTEDMLATELKVVNSGDAAFDFTTALHSYFDVSAIANLKIVGGFDGAAFLDKTQDPPTETPAEGNTITITKETDSVYKGVTGDVILEDSGKGRKLLIKSAQGWSDTVVWNPFGDEAMGADGFVCVEAAQALEPVKLEGGESWTATMDLIPSSL